MEYNRLSEHSKKSWFIARLITTVIVTIILLGAIYFTKEVLELGWVRDFSIYLYSVIGIIVVFLILNTFIYPAIEYAQWKYMITNDKVDFVEGIFSTKRTIIPIIRIQQITMEQGIINKRFNLVNVKIHTAGGAHVIPNIEKEKAVEISEYLKDKIKKKVIENDA